MDLHLVWFARVGAFLRTFHGAPRRQESELSVVPAALSAPSTGSGHPYGDVRLQGRDWFAGHGHREKRRGMYGMGPIEIGNDQFE